MDAPCTPTTRSGFTTVEFAVALIVASILAVAAVLLVNATLDRADPVLADTTIQRVVAAQVTHAAAFGTYAYGSGGSDAQLADALPESLARDVTLTHGESTGTDVVSIAVGDQQTLVVAVQLPDASCRWRTVPAITGDVEAQVTEQDPGVICVAADLLPPGETPAWE